MPLSDWRDGNDHLDTSPARSRSTTSTYLRANIARRRGLRLVLRQPMPTATRRPARRSPTAPTASLGVPLQGHRRAGGATALRPAGRRRERHADRLGAARQADLVHRARLPGGRQGRQPAQRLPRPEELGELAALFLARRARRPHPAPLPAALIEASSTRRSAAMSPAPTRCRPSTASRMVDLAHVHVWTWDARPYPAFPYALDVWADGDNWRARPLADRAVGGGAVADGRGPSSTTTASPRTTRAGSPASLDGYVIDRMLSAREALEPLQLAYFFDARERRARSASSSAALSRLGRARRAISSRATRRQRSTP